MLALGPCLIATVLLLVSWEIYWILTVLVPRISPLGTASWWAHVAWIYFLSFNGLFNYFSCVLTDPGTHLSPLYRALVLVADVDGALAPSDVATGLTRESLSHTRALTASWLERGPYEWGYCKQSRGPKAPRSHYDHVTRKLVLNMDHYCPWMFNCVGFANYRYFVLFLFYVTVACGYGAALTFPDFSTVAGLRSFAAFRGPRPTSRTHTAVMFTFVLSISVGIAVMLLFSWHLYLVLTAQTTIEFYGNCTLRRRARVRGHDFRNPYHRSYSTNWQHLFGTMRPIIALLPSSRPPPGRPWPCFQLRPCMVKSEIEV